MSPPNEYMVGIMERIQQIRDETRARRFMAIANLYEINGWRDIRFEKNDEKFSDDEYFEYEEEEEEDDEDVE